MERVGPSEVVALSSLSDLDFFGPLPSNSGYELPETLPPNAQHPPTATHVLLTWCCIWWLLLWCFVGAGGSYGGLGLVAFEREEALTSMVPDCAEPDRPPAQKTPSPQRLQPSSLERSLIGVVSTGEYSAK